LSSTYTAIFINSGELSVDPVDAAIPSEPRGRSESSGGTCIVIDRVPVVGCESLAGLPAKLQRLRHGSAFSVRPDRWKAIGTHFPIRQNSREEVYEFAWGCAKEGRPEPAAVAVICLAWLQRPENVLAGFLTWPDYRSKNWPNAVRIEHHKNKALVWHPLEETLDGETIKFYAEAEDVLSHLLKLGVPMIMRRIQKVQQMRKKIDGVSKLFTLDSCRHGGMTKLEEAELTDGHGRALSGHKTAQAYRGYAKETMMRA
ncbi:hypothetical protein BHE90_017809, partial [Fusarium euwallaceae]